MVDYLIISLFAALAVVSWQCYKDPPWEGFSALEFARSFYVSAGVAVVLWILQDKKILLVDNLGYIFLTIIAIERGIGELFKGFIRTKPHAEYAELFKRLGINFKNNLVKITAGLALFGIMAILIIFSVFLPRIFMKILPDKVLFGFILGFLGGLAVSTGGGLKDSSFEGFQIKKFFRSAIAGGIGGTILVSFASQLDLFIMACIGLERLGVEFYKTFYKQSIRGIFKDQKPTFPMWMEKRWIFIMTYLVSFAYFILLLTS